MSVSSFSNGHAQSILVAFGCAASALLLPEVAFACGVSGPDGISACSLTEHDEATRPHWAASASASYTSTRLRFSGDVHADQTRYTTLAALAYFPTPAWAVQFGAGVSAGGSLELPDGRHSFSAGPAALLGASWRVYDERVFVVLSSVLSFSAARTHLGSEPSVAYEAFDLRLGGEVGTTVLKILRPYVPVRVFGGPVYWRYGGNSVTGTDTHHYQVGLGVAVRLAPPLNVFAEGIPLGERSLSAGLALAL
jgi:hypothetical protein